jgi:hypothetical protein
MRRNIASQVICAQLISKTDGSNVTSGTTTVYYLGDGGTQTSGGGTVTHGGNGCWSYVPTQAETNFAHVAFTFTNTSAITVTVQVYTKQYDSSGYTNVSSGTGTGQISLSSGTVTVGTNNDKTGYTASTVTDKTGYALSAAGVDAILDEPMAAHTTADTLGWVINMLTQDSVTLSTDVALDSIFGQLLDNGSAWSYDRTTDSLEAIRDTPPLGTAMRGTDNAFLAASAPTNFSSLSINANGRVGINLDNTEGTLAKTTDITGFNDISASAVNAEVVDVLKTDVISELSVAIPAATPTFETALMMLYMMFRNKIDVDADWKEFHNDAGTIVFKKALTDAAGTYSEAETVSG